MPFGCAQMGNMQALPIVYLLVKVYNRGYSRGIDRDFSYWLGLSLIFLSERYAWAIQAIHLNIAGKHICGTVFFFPS